MARRYDHRIRNAIVASRSPELFAELDIPKSTIRDWLRKGEADVVTVAEFDMSIDELMAENRKLKAALEQAEAQAMLITEGISIVGFQLQYKRLPTADVKSRLIEVIQNASKALPIQRCLNIIQLSSARLTAWLLRERKCELEDYSSCPKLSPTQLLPSEVNKIREMVINPDFSHFSITSLSWYTKKTGEVVASPSAFSRIIRLFGLVRPGKRIYPPKPKIGVRASGPCQIWHLDLSVIKLTDTTRCFIQAVIDNFSRYVLAWDVSISYGGKQSRQLLLRAIKRARQFGFTDIPELYVDSGTENINADIDELIEAGRLTRMIAQIEIDFSNSLIEALFLRLKHRHLFKLKLTSFNILKEQTDFYLNEANDKIPLDCLSGATPLEIISGK